MNKFLKHAINDVEGDDERAAWWMTGKVIVIRDNDNIINFVAVIINKHVESNIN